MKSLTRMIITTLLLTVTMHAAYMDTGMIQWKQSDGTSFTARLWGWAEFWPFAAGDPTSQ